MALFRHLSGSICPAATPDFRSATHAQAPRRRIKFVRPTVPETCWCCHSAKANVAIFRPQMHRHRRLILLTAIRGADFRVTLPCQGEAAHVQPDVMKSTHLKPRPGPPFELADVLAGFGEKDGGGWWNIDKLLRLPLR